MAQSVAFDLNQPTTSQPSVPVPALIPDNNIQELHSADTFELRHANNPLMVPPAKMCLSDGKITKVNDHLTFWSSRFGTRAFEKFTYHPYSSRVQTRFDPSHVNLINIPNNQKEIMSAVDYRNAMPIRNGNLTYIFYKRFGLNPKLREITPHRALLELWACKYVKVLVGQFSENPEAAHDSLQNLRIFPDYIYRLNSLSSLHDWWKKIGSKFVLGELPKYN